MKELNDVQEELLNALKWLNDFCIKKSILYSLHGGTLLGAVREKGFIAWDDDADVTFTRAEYQKFEALVFQENCNLNIIFDSDRRYPKIFFKREGKPAVWIDVFIYDAISESRIIQKLKKVTLYYYMMILRDSETFEIIRKTRKQNPVLLLFMKAVNAWGKHIPYEKKVQGAKNAAQRFGGSGKLIHRANDQKSGINEIQPSYVMTKFVMIPFEDTELMVSVYYDEILTLSYGKDYMTPKKKINQATSDAVVANERKAVEELFASKGNQVSYENRIEKMGTNVT